MSKNNSTDYNELKKFDLDLEFGQQFESLIDDIFSGDAKTEVKTERDQWIGYGNMCVETMCSGKPSGLTSTEASYWVHNFSYKGELIFSLMVPVDRLRKVVKEMEEDKVSRTTKGGDGWRSKLALIPIDRILEYLRKGAKDGS